jgi:hypothetical protein
MRLSLTPNDSSYLVNLDQVYDIVGEEDWIHGDNNCLANLASTRTITLSWGAKKKESIKQRSVLSDEGLQVGNHVVVENHGKQWPHKAEIIDIDMENNTASIRWETTQKVDLVDLEDLKQFSLKNALSRKQKPIDFYNPSSGKKLHQLSNVKMTDLIWKVAQKINFIVRRTFLSCALRVWCDWEPDEYTPLS